MNLTEKENNGISIIEVEGSLDTNTSQEAEKRLMEMIEKKVDKIIVDFTSLNYVSSAGLRVLLFIAKQLKGINGSLKVCGLNETVQEVFDISGFSSILDVYPTAEEASKSF